VLALPLAAYPVALRPSVTALGVAGMLLLAAALLRPAATLVPWALASLGAGYGLALLLADDDLDPRAGFYAAGMLLVAELALWSVEARRWPREDRAAARLRLAGLLVLALAAATIGTLLVAAGAAVPAGAQAVQVVGALGAVGALLALALLARR
jgi:hypothetical protein